AENLTHEAVAAAVGIHPVHLARVFRYHFGATLGDYVRRLRVEFAARQLITTEETLAGIALAAGFSDQSHFTRTFKRQTGMTPCSLPELQPLALSGFNGALVSFNTRRHSSPIVDSVARSPRVEALLQGRPLNPLRKGQTVILRHVLPTRRQFAALAV